MRTSFGDTICIRLSCFRCKWDFSSKVVSLSCINNASRIRLTALLLLLLLLLLQLLQLQLLLLLLPLPLVLVLLLLLLAT